MQFVVIYTFCLSLSVTKKNHNQLPQAPDDSANQDGADSHMADEISRIALRLHS